MGYVNSLGRVDVEVLQPSSSFWGTRRLLQASVEQLKTLISEESQVVFFSVRFMTTYRESLGKQRCQVARDFHVFFSILNEELFWNRSESSSHQERVDDEMVDVFLVTHQDDGMRVFTVRGNCIEFFQGVETSP